MALNGVQRLGLGLANKRDFSTKERKDLAKTGAALPDGSYPITNEADLKHAISCVGLGGDGKAAIKNHIQSRAKALGLEDSLPEAWAAKKLDEFADDGGDPTLNPVLDKLSTPAPYQDVIRLRSSISLKDPTPWGPIDIPPSSVQRLQSVIVGPNPVQGDASTPILATHRPSFLLPTQDITPTSTRPFEGSMVGLITKAENEAAAKLVMLLFNARNTLHLLHLQTSSFSVHKALDDLYKELPELADQFIEAYQGKYGVITGYPAAAPVTAGDPIAYVEGLSKDFKAMRGDVAQDSELQNLLDETASAIDGALYKLKNLH